MTFYTLAKHSLRQEAAKRQISLLKEDVTKRASQQICHCPETALRLGELRRAVSGARVGEGLWRDSQPSGDTRGLHPLLDTPHAMAPICNEALGTSHRVNHSHRGLLAPGCSSGCLSESENIYRDFSQYCSHKMPGTHSRLQATLS